ncbi:hypothetical protein BU15DRAFT_69926 [Melanogaster broomeanus]|nr:hypothetical protein BU15DRAFT_69926 [Melanogaster broomeanus]
MPSASNRDPEIFMIQGSVLPSVDEFLRHPDFQQIATFFLGWVFICSLLSIASSPAVRSLARSFKSYISIRLSSAPVDSTVVVSCVEKPLDSLCHSRRANLRSREENHFLVLMLFVCFAFGSIADFSSQLTFDARSGSSVCPFVIAWGGISASCGRLFGLVTLCLELQKLDVTTIEKYAMGVWIFAAIASVFAENATSIGTTDYLPTALTKSLVFIALEFYIFLRLMWLIAPGFLSLRHRVGAIGDSRALRTASLILLELLTVVPGAKFVGIVGEFVPFTIGSLVVLAAFNKPILCHATPDDGASLSWIGATDPAPHLPRSYKTLSIIHPHIPNHPYVVGGSSPSTIRITPSVLWPHTTGSARGSIEGSTTALTDETATVHIASRMRPACPRDTPPHVHSHTAVKRLSPATSPRPPSLAAYTSHTLDDNDVPDGPMPNKSQHKNRILSRQGEYGARFEAEQEDRVQRRVLPIPPSLRLVIPPKAQHTPAPSTRPQSASSPLYGSDIIRRNTRKSLSHLFLSATEKHSSSGHSWMSLVRSAVSADPLPLPETPDRWLTFGNWSSSPTRRKTFTNQSNLSALPSELTDVRSRSRVGRRSTFDDPPAYDYHTPRSVNRGSPSPAAEQTSDASPVKPMETTEGECDVSQSLYPRPRENIATRIRGPRPLPKASLRTAF